MRSHARHEVVVWLLCRDWAKLDQALSGPADAPGGREGLLAADGDVFVRLEGG